MSSVSEITGNISVGKIENRIFQIRGKRVMLDMYLAELYGVETKQLTRQVRRNIERFPEDFMFMLSRKEYRDFLRCQIGTLEKGRYSKRNYWNRLRRPKSAE